MLFTTTSSPRPRLTYRTKACALTLALVLVSAVVLSAVVSFPASALAGVNGNYKSLGYLTDGLLRTNFRFVVATDSHLGSGQGNAKTKDAFSDMASQLTDIPFMIHMGDITETGASTEYDLFAEYCEKLPFKVYGTMGNHESRWQDPTGSSFKANLGAPNLSFDYGAWHFVILNTSSPTQTLGTLDATTLSWLERDLESQPKNKPVAVFSHHPLCYEPRAFQDSDDAFLDLVNRYPIQVVFSGHGHSFIAWNMQGRSFQMIGALMDAAYSAVEVEGLKMSVYSVTQAGTAERATRLESTASLKSTPSPLSDLTVSYEEESLTIGFDLSRQTDMTYQIDGGSFGDWGTLPAGHHEFSLDVSGYSKGMHTFRLRANTPAGNYMECSEFAKDADDLLLWSLDLGSNVSGELQRLGSDKAIVGTSDGVIRCLQIETGSTVWEYRAGSVWGGGTVDDNRLYFGTADGRLTCLDASSGTLVWQSRRQGPSFVSAPLVYDAGYGKSVVIGSTEGSVYSHSVFTGITRWTAKAKGAVVSTPCSGNGKVFFGAWDNTLYAVNDSDGSSAWSRQLGRQIYYSPYHPPVFHLGKVFTTIPYDSIPGASYLYALDSATGETVWTYTSSSSLLTPVLPAKMATTDVRGNHLVALDGAGRAVRVRVSDGQFVGQSPAASSLFGFVPIGDGIWVSGGSRGTLSITTENRVYDYKVRDSFLFQEPLITRKGILQGDTRGTLWAVKVLD